MRPGRTCGPAILVDNHVADPVGRQQRSRTAACRSSADDQHIGVVNGLGFGHDFAPEILLIIGDLLPMDADREKHRSTMNECLRASEVAD